MGENQGTEKGRWWCEGKPREANFHIHDQDDVLERIKAGTSEFARSAGVTGPYNPNAAAQGALPPGATAMPVYQGQQPARQSRREAPREAQREVDFEDIQDDWQYQLAQELYHERPDEIVEFGRDAFLLFEDAQAVLRVTARRSVDLVDIETFRSDRGLFDCWDEILEETGN
jgi:hypothetical protein